MKAKIKQIEDFPQNEKCCEATIRQILPFCGKVVELVGEPKEINHPCPNCGQNLKSMGFQTKEFPNTLLPVTTIDIDEGSIQ